MAYWRDYGSYNLVIIGSGNRLSIARCQTITQSFLNYCQLDSEEQTPINLETYYKLFYSTKYI